MTAPANANDSAPVVPARPAAADYEALFRLTRQAFAVAALDDIICAANPAFAALHGRSPDELEGMPLAALVAPACRVRQGDEDAACEREDSDVHVYESQHLRRDGTVFPVLVECMSSFDAQGLPYRVYHVEDLTLQRQAEAARQESETRLHAVMEQMPSGLIMVDSPSGRTVLFNAEAERILGHPLIPVDDVAGYANYGGLHPDGTPYAPHEYPIARALGGETVFGHILPYRRGDGVMVEISVNAAPIRDGEGRITHVVAALTDVTAPRRVASELARTSALLAGITRGTTDPVFAKDRAGRYLFANPVAAHIIGHPENEIIGRTDAELLPPDIWPAIMQTDRDIMEAGESRVVEEIVGDGEEKTFLSTKDPLRDGAGQVIGLVGVSRDITELKRHQGEIAALNAQLQRAMMETHHRVKNNLQVVAALAEMSSSEEPQAAGAALARVGQHVRSLAAIHDLLTHRVQFAAGGTGAILSVSLMDRLIPLLQATTRGHTLHARVEPFYLATKEAAAVALLVSELVSNAVKHTRGSILVSLEPTPTLTPEGQPSACLKVEDDGPGFPDGFDPVRAANIGLELVLTLAKHDLQGDVRFDNRPESGGRVIVTFAATLESGAA